MEILWITNPKTNHPHTDPDDEWVGVTEPCGVALAKHEGDLTFAQWHTGRVSFTWPSEAEFRNLLSVITAHLGDDNG